MAKQTKHLITKEGLEKLKKELEYLKTGKAAEIAARLKEALSYGDLRENAEYQSAREEELLNDARIREIEDEISNSEIISGKQKSTGTVEMGSKVKAKNITDDETIEFEIVGSTEMDPLEFKFSNESELGAAALGKKKGDKFTYSAPRGEIEFEILSVK